MGVGPTVRETYLELARGMKHGIMELEEVVGEVPREREETDPGCESVGGGQIEMMLSVRARLTTQVF